MIKIKFSNKIRKIFKVLISDSKKSSTCEMIYDLMTTMKFESTKEISELLYVGMISDTNLLSNNRHFLY